ncbi:MAG: T9SS type A sorting domain-containing protein, partial [Bacteroidota bacterium]
HIAFIFCVTFDPFISAVEKNGTSLFTGTMEGIYRSGNNGLTWSKEICPLSNSRITFLTSISNTLLAGSDLNGIAYRKMTNDQWLVLNEGFRDSAVNTAFVFKAFIFAGTAQNGAWKIPVQEISNITSYPDTLFLGQFSNDIDTLHIHTSVDWNLIGSIPDWLEVQPTHGSGESEVIFRTQKSNPSAIARNVSFFFFAPNAGTASVTVIQRERSFGLEEQTFPIKITPIPSTGLIHISSDQRMTSVEVVDAYGRSLLLIHPAGTIFTIDLSKENPGLYFILIRRKNITTVHKIIILK